jgi:rSAM/selenodomain-associated transferase 2
MIERGEVLNSHGAMISVIMPVLNEGPGINEAVSRLRALDPGRCAEIIVVDGDPAGSTVKAIIDSGVRSLAAEKGRARQMNRGAELAGCAVLLFLHADTFLPPDVFPLILDAMSDARVVAGAFDLGIDTDRRIFRITEKYVFFRNRLTRVPFGDQAIFIRKDYFDRIGGYRDIPLMEDVELMKRIRKRGDRIRIIPVKVRTSPRRYEREGVLYGTFRNWLLQILYALGVSPERLAKWYRS